MKARKVAILLAITALGGLTLFVLSLIDDSAFGAQLPEFQVGKAVPDTLDYFREQITVGPDGNASVEVLAVLVKGGSGDLLLPFAFEDGYDFAILSGPAIFAGDNLGKRQPIRDVLGYKMLNLLLSPDAGAGDTLVVSAQVPGWFDRKKSRQEYGEFSMGRQYINTSQLVFRNFELGLNLPASMLVHSVTKVIPAYDPKKSPEPPYSIGKTQDRGWATLRLDNLPPAGTCRLDLHIRPAKRGPIPLVAGLIAAILYLVFFRDVLKAKETE